MNVKFELDYLSDFINLVLMKSNMDGTPQPWNLDFEIDDKTLKKLQEIGKNDKIHFKEQEKKRVFGDNFQQWRKRCDEAWYWTVLEKLNERYSKYWESKKEKLKQNKERKEKIWKNNFNSFFEDTEKITGLEWNRDEYIVVISDSMYMGGYWDPFGRNIAYVGAYSDENIYKYVSTHELLHLLVEQENVSYDYFNQKNYPELITHDIMELVISIIQGEIDDFLALTGAIQYLTYCPSRRWILFKKVYITYSSDKKVYQLLEDIKEELSDDDLEKYQLLYNYEDPVSILLDH